MSDPLAITPRNLGAIRLAKYCPKCFAILLKMRFRAPFNHFGAALFSDAQKCEEAILGLYLDRDGCLPKQFAPFCDCSARVDCSKDWRKYAYMHKSGVRLYGSPDEVLHVKDGTLAIVDHKTAHVKDKEDPFHPQYETQVIGYADIAEGLNLGRVSLGGLLYWEVQTDAVTANPSEHYEKGQLWMPLKPKGVEIEIDYTILDPLLEEAKKIWNSKQLPAGREGCDDCKRLDLLYAIDKKAEMQDSQIALMYRCTPYADEASIQRNVWRQYGRLSLLSQLDELGDSMFSSDGVASNWEFFD